MINRRYKIILCALLFAAPFILSSCDDNLLLNEAEYQPKIVIAGLVIPGRRVENIYVGRNYPINKNVNLDDLYLRDAKVVITDMQSNTSYELQEYNNAYCNLRGNLRIGFGKSYRLDVTAEVEGKQLTASSITTTPKYGFRVYSHNQSLKYREKDSSGVLKNFQIKFKPSEGATFYMFTINSSHPSISNFIFENPYIELDTSYVIENFNTFSPRYVWIMNMAPDEIYSYDFNWLNFWFYDSYDIIAYAGDKNYHYFMATYGNVQEIDGNFHEPKFNITGDGIGYFGSAIMEHIFIEVRR